MNIELVSKEVAIKIIAKHESYVTQTPIILNEKTKTYEFMKVELLNGCLNGLFRVQLGNPIKTFKYKI